MYRTYGPGPSLWESLLPEPALRMPAELVRVDALLDDPAFFEPFRPFFHPVAGRPSTPIETYLRLMFLKYRYKLGFEALCREVADSVSWSRFCRIPLGGRVPDASTLKKLTTRCGETAVAALNQALLAKAAEAKVLKVDKVRGDTTVVPADVAYPTDSGLMARGVARLVALVAVLHGLGLASRTKMRDRGRSLRRRAHDIGAWLRRRSDEAKEEAKAITGEMASIAELSLAEARQVAVNARRGISKAGDQTTGKARATLAELELTIARLERVVAQTKLRLAGTMPGGSTRLVSLHDPDARPIAKGRLGRPVEFGYLAQILDNADGVVLDHEVMVGNPADGPLLAPAIARIKALAGRAPRAVTADRGYGEAKVQVALEALGVKVVAIVRKGRPGAARQQVQRRRSFVKLIKWRTGCEARVACMKRDFGWSRSRMDGIDGTGTWCGWGVLAHNSIKISGLLDAMDPRPPATTHRRPSPRTGAAKAPPRTDPPPSLPLSA